METEIREYNEEMEVEVGFLKLDESIKPYESGRDILRKTGRWIIMAKNEEGRNYTEVDLLDLIDWVKKNKPELL